MDMMIFADTKFDDEDSMKYFRLQNSLSHSNIAKSFKRSGLPIESYPLNTVGDEKDWLLVHNEVHQQEIVNLGITEQVDLSEVDFSNQEQFYEWMQRHALLHQYVENALGL